jgi:hypothetical protein
MANTKKDYGEGKYFWECTEEQMKNRVERYKRGNEQIKTFTLLAILIAAIGTIMSILINKP